MGPVKAHHVLPISALIGMIPAKMFTWGDVLEESCGPHKFFCHLYNDGNLTIDETRAYFNLFYKKLRKYNGGRVTKT